MRILVTLPWGERLGGAETMLQMVLDGAHEAGHQFELVFFESGSWPDELIDAGFRVEVISAGRLRQAHRWVATVARLARIIRARQPDLVLNWAAKTQLYGAPAAMLAGMANRVAWWQQLIPTGHWLDRCATVLPASAIGCYSTAAARGQARLFPSRPTFVVAAGAPVPRAGSEGAVTPCAGSEGAVAARVGSEGAVAARVGSEGAVAARVGSEGAVTPRVGSEGAVTARVGSEGTSLQLPPDVPVVGLVGRLQPWKGQDRLLRAHALLRERGHSVHTVIVGGDAYGLSSQYAASLQPLIRRLGLADAVTMTGHVPDAGPYIEQLDILVNASDPEPFGIVLLEGMARGVPVVAVDSGGPAEFVEHGKTGVLARSGEPGALADALEALLVSPALRQTLGRAGRELFLRDFTEVAMRKRFFHQIEALVECPTTM
jgi:glycosyltransferase involved in cell wall biosynthesis